MNAMLILPLLINWANSERIEQCQNLTYCEDSISAHKNGEKVLTIGLLLPAEGTETDPYNLEHHNRLQQVRMGLEVIAAGNSSIFASPVAKVLPGWQIKVITGDTQCSSATGPLEAFRLHCQAGRCLFYTVQSLI